MQTYRADIRCTEPVANGFACGNEDEITFSYLGEMLTHERAKAMINDEEHVARRCWKCFSQNWMIKSLFPIAYQSQAVATRD